MEYPGLKSVLEALKTNTYLKVIHLHHLTMHTSFKYLMNKNVKCLILQKLDLSGNGIKSEHVKELSVFLEINEHLEILNLSKNFLNKERGLTIFVYLL